MQRKRALVKKVRVYRLETHCVTSFWNWKNMYKECCVANIATSALNLGRFLLKITKRSPILVFTNLTALQT
jgi:hypothetical protein